MEDYKIEKEEEKMEYKEAKGLRRLTGLMFRTKHTSPLIFKFEEEVTTPIHSLFVFFSFEARWYDSDFDLIEQKIVVPFKTQIKPDRPFRVLTEIPIIAERRSQ